MLRALYDYGISHPELILPFGCAKRTMHYVVALDAQGDAVGIRPSESKTVVAPDAGGKTRGGGGTCNVCIEKASIVLGLDPGVDGKKLERVEAKRACFRNYFMECMTAVPEAGLVLDLLDDSVCMDALRDMAVDVAVKPGDMVGFSVDGVLVSDMPSVRDWWAGRESSIQEPTSLDIVTGEPCCPVLTMKMLTAKDLPGGQSSGVGLVTFNSAAFESYGMSQNQNAPMGARTAGIVIDALSSLCARGEVMAGTRFIHWYEGAEPARDEDIFEFSMFGLDDMSEKTETDEAAMDEAAGRLVRSPLDGTVPVSLAGSRYHIAMLSPQVSRSVIRYYAVGSYEDLYSNFRDWFDDMALCNSAGTGLLRPLPLKKMWYGLLTASELAKLSDKYAGLQPHMMPVVQACLNRTALPGAILSRTLSRIQSDVLDSEKSVNSISPRWLKAYLVRTARARGESAHLMPYLNEQHPNPAYHCGRAMAIYGMLQADTNKVNSGVVERYFAACSRSPALALGSLQSLANHHLSKIKWQNKKLIYQMALESAYGAMGPVLPKSLNMEDRGYFTLGYIQQQAALRAAFSELRKNNTDEEEEEDV